MKKVNIIVYLLLLCHATFSQVDNFGGHSCEMEDPLSNLDILGSINNSSSNCNRSSNLWDDYLFWEPDLNEPIKFVNVNMIFLQKDDGSGNFQQGNIEHDQHWTEIEASVNQRLAGITTIPDPTCGVAYPTSPSCYSSINNIPDSRIRFKFNRIYIQDTQAWNNDVDPGYKCPSGNWYLDNLDNQIINDPTIPRGVNLYFSQGETNYNKNFHLSQCPTDTSAFEIACSQYPSYSNYNRSSRVHMPDRYSKYYWMKNCYSPQNNVPWSVVKGWNSYNTAGTILHEVGHSFGLGHCNGCENHMMSQCGNCSRSYLTPRNISQMHRVLSITNMRTFVEDNMAPNNGINSTPNNFNFISFNGVQTIDFNTKFYRDIVVEQGGVLNITCKVIMPKGGQIIVKPGAKLVVDGGTITSESEDFWDGIILMGNNSHNQLPLNQPIYQAKLELKNGAIIENVLNAISFGGSGSWSDFGGLVQAEDATISVCRRAVEFMSYPFINHSYFKRCTFEYVSAISQIPLPLVTLWDTYGVNFNGCTFVDNTGLNQYDISNGSGIFSIDAGYQVTADCNDPSQTSPCGAQYITKSSFRNLNVGVKATSSGTDKTLTITDTDFEDNSEAVVINAFDNIRFENNTVIVGGLLKTNYTNFYTEQYGMKVNYSSGYEIENNVFEGKNNPVLDVVGLRIAESGPEANEVYRNDFKNNRIAQSFHGLNRSRNQFEGLQFLCNTNSVSNFKDVEIEVTSPNFNNFHGIRTYQGSTNPAQSAGNVFSSNPSSVHIENNRIQGIIYYYNSASEAPTNYTAGIVMPIQVANANGCPEQTIGNLSPALFYSLRSQYEGLLYNYHQQIDNGNTDSLVNAINMAWSNEAEELRNELLSYSPYLSEQALWEAAESGVLTDAFLLEVALANMDATRNEAFLNFVEFDIPNTLPSSMVQLIYQSWSGETPRTLLESQLANINNQMGSFSNRLLHNYMTNNSSSTDSIYSLLDARKSTKSKYRAIEVAIANADYQKVNSYLLQLDNIEFSEADNAEHINFLAYVQFRESMKDNSKNILQLDESELTSLRTIASAQSGRSSQLAHNVLCFGYGECDTNQEPEARMKSRRVYDMNKVRSSGILSADIQISPNPAKDHFMLTLNKFDDYVAYTIRITNLNGQKILEKAFFGNVNQFEVSHLENGAYFYEVTSNDESLHKGKIVILR